MDTAAWIEVVVGLLVAIAGGGAIVSLFTIRRQNTKIAAETESIAMNTMNQALTAANDAAGKLRDRLAEMERDQQRSNDLIIDQAKKIGDQAAEIRSLKERVAILETHIQALEGAR